jgi:hypothetical protein
VSSPDQVLEPRVFAFEPALALWGAGRLERFRGIRQELVAPLIVLAWLISCSAHSAPIGKSFSPSSPISAFCSRL